jgi:2-dehydro-3-deoxygluconokinase
VSDAPAFDVLTFGEAMALFIARESGPLDGVETFHRAVAGAELNVAIGLARLGLRVAYASRVGDDTFGRVVLATLEREGISRTHVMVDRDHSTGFMLKSLAPGGADADIDYYRRGSAASHLGCGDVPPGFGTAARHLHLTGISPALSGSMRDLAFHLANEARRGGRSVSFDPNLRPRLWPTPEAMTGCLNELAFRSDLVLPGLAEGRVLTGWETAPDIASFYRDRGVRRVVVKLGAAGAYYADDDGCATVAAPVVGKVVDTVGAGDGFATGVISALLEGRTLHDAVVRGNMIGARVVQFPGDSDGLPTRGELEAMAMAVVSAG